MYKLNDEYWSGLAKIVAVLIILIFLFFCVGQIDQYLFESDIDKYIAANGKEPSYEISDKIRRSVKFKTLPLMAILMFGLNFLLTRYWSKPKEK